MSTVEDGRDYIILSGGDMMTINSTQAIQICPDCHGNGYIVMRWEGEEVIEQCKTCNSQGEVVEESGVRS